MKIDFRDGLLFTSISINFEGKEKVINNVIIDTGAAHSHISSDIAEEIGIVYENGDRLITMFGIGGEDFAFRKSVSQVKLGPLVFENYPLDFGFLDIENGINGLIGLDLLIQSKAVIDLGALKIHIKAS
ncbi:Aspartyl protease [Anaerovirgula multivorans]|uniref:Aspartyl protease n=1 Tax=Anaerovirgula multivorans TaxID=312168 RepID=A0A239G6S2_9FIRM|nr:retropepsin-like aspartic protease [Anaerovirgula multivorans]SNS64392.1 Aspartyl protease [Anaerovirgula multivorans]